MTGRFVRPTYARRHGVASLTVLGLSSLSAEPAEVVASPVRAKATNASTSSAGIKAISLLHSHGFAVAVNTARTLQEVKQYCLSYGFAGGVAEYGGIAWDAVSNRELVLVSLESLQQLEQVRHAIQKIPGIFLNDDYRYSLRAFTYQNGRTAPLPPLLIQDLLAGLKVDRLHVHGHHASGGGVPGDRHHVVVGHRDRVAGGEAGGAGVDHHDVGRVGVERIRVPFAIIYVDHNVLAIDAKNPDDHLFLQTFCARYGLHADGVG